MDTLSSPDPLSHLPRDAYRYLVYTLRKGLPQPDDMPEAVAWRDHAAIAQVAALCPVNAAEAALAAQYVAAHAQAMDSLRLARDAAVAGDWVLRCAAQSACMMRQAQGALRLLLRTQAERRRLEADNHTADLSTWTAYCAEQWMTQALAAESERGVCQDVGQGLVETKPETDSDAIPPTDAPHDVDAPHEADAATSAPDTPPVGEQIPGSPMTIGPPKGGSGPGTEGPRPRDGLDSPWDPPWDPPRDPPSPARQRGMPNQPRPPAAARG